jgi:predicted amidophosphoribosyltransferase
MASIDQHKGSVVPLPAAVVAVAAPPQNVCPHCNAKFERALKFCGECGKPMTEVVS